MSEIKELYTKKNSPLLPAFMIKLKSEVNSSSSSDNKYISVLRYKSNKIKIYGIHKPIILI